MGTRAYKKVSDDYDEDNIQDKASRVLTGQPGRDIREPIFYILTGLLILGPYPQAAFIGLIILAFTTGAKR